MHEVDHISLVKAVIGLEYTYKVSTVVTEHEIRGHTQEKICSDMPKII